MSALVFISTQLDNLKDPVNVFIPNIWPGLEWLFWQPWLSSPAVSWRVGITNGNNDNTAWYRCCLLNLVYSRLLSSVYSVFPQAASSARSRRHFWSLIVADNVNANTSPHISCLFIRSQIHFMVILGIVKTWLHFHLKGTAEHIVAVSYLILPKHPR